MDYQVAASWNEEAKVWHSTSNVPGLVVEAATRDEFERLVLELVPELLAANTDLRGVSVPVQIITERTRQVAVT